jgi:hypothetical protein
MCARLRHGAPSPWASKGSRWPPASVCLYPPVGEFGRGWADAQPRHAYRRRLQRRVLPTRPSSGGVWWPSSPWPPHGPWGSAGFSVRCTPWCRRLTGSERAIYAHARAFHTRRGNCMPSPTALIRRRRHWSSSPNGTPHSWGRGGGHLRARPARTHHLCQSLSRAPLRLCRR